MRFPASFQQKSGLSPTRQVRHSKNYCTTDGEKCKLGRGARAGTGHREKETVGNVHSSCVLPAPPRYIDSWFCRHSSFHRLTRALVLDSLKSVRRGDVLALGGCLCIARPGRGWRTQDITRRILPISRSGMANLLKLVSARTYRRSLEIEPWRDP